MSRRDTVRDGLVLAAILVVSCASLVLMFSTGTRGQTTPSPPQINIAHCNPPFSPIGSIGCQPPLGTPQAEDLILAWRPSLFPNSSGSLRVADLGGGGSGFQLWHDGEVAAIGPHLRIVNKVIDAIVPDTTDCANLPSSVCKIPTAFVIPGKPSAGEVLNNPVPITASIPAGCAGSVAYAGTAPAADATFTLNLIHGTSPPASVCTIKITAGSHATVTLAGAGGTVAVGDVMQMVAPATQDAAMTNVGVSILVSR